MRDHNYPEEVRERAISRALSAYFRRIGEKRLNESDDIKRLQSGAGDNISANHKNIGSGFDGYLEGAGLLKHCESVARERTATEPGHQLWAERVSAPTETMCYRFNNSRPKEAAQTTKYDLEYTTRLFRETQAQFDRLVRMAQINERFNTITRKRPQE